MFYTYFGSDYNSILLRGYKDGKQFTERLPYQPYLFMPSQEESEYHTVEGKPVKRLDFDSVKEARDFCRTYADVPNVKLYGMNLYHYVYIYEMFGKGITVDQNLIKILNFDIETDTQTGFGNIQQADKEIVSISMKLFGSNDIYVMGLKPYTPTEPELTMGKWNIHYKQCSSEKEMLLYFITIWKRMNPDAISGWNIEGFDIPYIIKRITYVLSEERAKDLSPFKKIDKREVTMYGRTNDMYDIVGIANLDYLQVYKKFSFTNEESYSLNYISEKNLGAKKLDYSEYGSLANLWLKNHNKFIDYNIVDILRVEQLNDKLRFFDIVFAVSYEALVNYADTFTTIRNWDVLIHNYLMDRKIVVPFSTYNSKEYNIAGGYVKEVTPAKYKWVMSFDFRSLYPHLSMTFNISPETYLGKLPDVHGEFSVEKILNGELKKHAEDITKHNVSVSGKGTIFSKDRQGFVPAIMERLFARRANYQKTESESEQLISDIKAELKRRGVEYESI